MEDTEREAEILKQEGTKKQKRKRILTTRRQMSDSVPLALLLALTGGFLDAYTYVTRGGVFANAQTGNIVLLGIGISEGAWQSVLGYLAPILAFASGILIAELIRRWGGAGLHWRQAALLIEAAILGAVGFMPVSMNWAANICVSFACALQVESFRKVHGNAFATTMCTGNLRSAMEMLFRYFDGREKNMRNKSLLYCVVILTFAAGAALGNKASSIMGVSAVFLCALLLLAGFGIMFIRGEEERREEKLLQEERRR